MGGHGMGAGKGSFSRRGFILGAGATVTGGAVTAGVGGAGRAAAAARPAATVYFQSDGGIKGAYLAGQLAGNGQSVGSLAFITSAARGNLELLSRGGAGTFVKLSYLDGGGTERTGLAVSTGTSAPIISVAPEANGAASLDLENNDLVGVETVVPSPDSAAQLRLDGLLSLTPQAPPAVPASGGVLYLSTAGGALKFTGRSGTVTTIAPA
jgi:hypothetical protein